MKLLMFSLAVDGDDPALSFALGWIEGLARRVDEVTVITMREGKHELPRNVRVLSVGQEKGYSKPHRTALFYSTLIKVILERRPEACFSHMNHVFSALAGPVLRIAGIPLFTWYAHRQGSGWLRLAHLFSRKMLTSAKGTYPYGGPKVICCGQGIDTDLFKPEGSFPQDAEPLLLSAGRISPIKGIGMIVRALGLLRERNVPFRAALVGEEPGGRSEYTRELRDEIERLGLEDVVELPGKATREELVDWYRRCSLHINASPPGLFDKTVLEAISCGRPSLVCSPDFGETLGEYEKELTFRRDEPSDLADRLECLLRLGPDELEVAGAYLRERVVRLHDLDRLMGLLLGLFREEAPC